jgi:hypothetical protein
MAEVATITTVVGALKVLPQVIEVGKDVWNELKARKEPKIELQNGIVNKTYYSQQFKFRISIPNGDKWRFWLPTPQYLLSFGLLFSSPGRDLPIMILSSDMVKLYRPSVSIVIEEVGTYTTIKEVVDVTLLGLEDMQQSVDKNNVHIYPEKSSAIIIASRPYYFETTLYLVQQLFIYAGRGYYVSSNYVPLSENSPEMWPDLHEIMNSFAIIKDTDKKR